MWLIEKWFQFFCFSAFFSLGLVFCVPAESSANSFTEQPRKSTAPVQSFQAKVSVNKKIILERNLLKPVPEDIRAGDPMVLLELFPWVRELNRWIPRRFSLAEHDVILDPNQIVIRHQFANARLRSAQKNAILTLSYSGTMGRGMNTQLEMPLFYSPAWGLFGWERYPFGNYTMTILRGGSVGGEIYLRAMTRF